MTLWPHTDSKPPWTVNQQQSVNTRNLENFYFLYAFFKDMQPWTLDLGNIENPANYQNAATSIFSMQVFFKVTRPQTLDLGNIKNPSNYRNAATFIFFVCKCFLRSRDLELLTSETSQIHQSIEMQQL